MSGLPDQSPLRKMIRDARDAGQEAIADRSFADALERAAERLWGMTLDVEIATQTSRSAQDISGILPEHGLVAVLDGPASGAVYADMSIVSAIVEHRTIGFVLPTLDTDRVATRVDAALLAPLLDVALNSASVDNESQASVQGSGYRFGAMVSDKRTLCLGFDDGSYSLFDLTLSLAQGRRRGRLILAFAEAMPSDEDRTMEGGQAQVKATLKQNVRMSHAKLDAVLARLNVPLKKVQDLKPGDTLPLPPDALHKARLEVSDENHAIAVTLGQMNGFRAVRLKPDGAVQGGQQRTRPDVTTAPAMSQLQPPDEPGIDVMADHDISPKKKGHPQETDGLDDLEELLALPETSPA